jgi:hypothetical protein
MGVPTQAIDDPLIFDEIFPSVFNKLALTRSIFLLTVTGLSFIGAEAGMLLEVCVLLSPKSENVSCSWTRTSAGSFARLPPKMVWFVLSGLLDGPP